MPGGNYRMTNLEISWVFEEIADLMEIKGENPYKIRAYREGARAVRALAPEVKELYACGRLKEVRGIGPALAAKIGELLTTGRCQTLDQLREEVPAALRQALLIPGLGVKTVARLYRELGVRDLEELARAAENRRVRQLKGLSSKTELTILRGVDMLQRQGDRFPLGIARPVAQELQRSLMAFPGVAAVAFAGSLRRYRETVGDIDLVISAPGDYRPIAEVFRHHPLVKETLEDNGPRVKVRTVIGLEAEISVVEPERFPLIVLYATGSKSHLAQLRELAAQRGLALAEEGVICLADRERLPVTTEEEVYHLLGLSYIPPELREGKGEIARAARGALPRLVELGDIKGDLHLHTRWSDGGDSLEEMVLAARDLGYRYIAITDHSRSLGIAGGLSIERLLEQHREIEALNRRYDDLTILKGAEVDILKDGALDYPAEILEQFDLVIASVHSGFKMSRAEMTARVVRALENPWVHILAHPTGRILGRREGYDIDLDEVFRVAAARGKILEINAAPDRLDLNDEAVYQAKALGIPIAIDTDAHDKRRLQEMEYGVATARRGWLEAGDVLNTLPADQLFARLALGKGVCPVKS